MISGWFYFTVESGNIGPIGRFANQSQAGRIYGSATLARLASKPY
jgi:hypothetical protein